MVLWGGEMNRMTRRNRIAAAAASAALAGLALAQSPSTPAPFTQIMRYSQTEATTARFDAQRSGWIRLDHFIAPEKMTGFALQWKKKIENGAGAGALSGGIVASGGLGITLAYLGGSANRTVAIDMDNGHVFFNRAYGAAAGKASAVGCSSASLAEPTKNTPLTPAMPGNPTQAGQSAVGPNSQLPYGSVLGEPGAGIPPVKPGSYFATPGSFFGATGAKPFDGTPASAVAGAAYAATGPAGGGGGRGRGPAGGSGAPGGRGPVNADGGAPGFGAGGPGGGSGRGPNGGGGGGRGGFGVGNATFAISNDGVLHGLTTHDGLDGMQPIPFLPAGASATDLIMINGVVYTSTVNGCGGAPNGVWAMTPAAIPAGGTFPKSTTWATGGTASPHGPSFSADGVAFVATSSGTGQGDSVISLDAATLAVKNTFHLAGANFVSAPVIFRVGTQDIVAAQAADGRVFLLDGANLSAPLAVSPAATNPGGYKPAALASWQDSTGQRWIVSTTATSVVAWKVALNGSSATLTQGWTLGGLKTPLAPLVINGVVFAVSGGETILQSKGTAAAGAAPAAAPASTPAVLYAVNGMTGAKIWDSGKTITSFVPHNSAVWNSMGQVLVGASDGTLYAFGVALDRHL